MKAFGRRAQARQELHKCSDALDGTQQTIRCKSCFEIVLSDAESGLRLEPANKELQELVIVLQMAQKKKQLDEKNKSAAEKSSSHQTTSSRALVMLRQLVSLLDEHIAMAKANLAMASQRGPMHGVLLALR